ncbi:hypothetical protein CU669_05610 [Paramagnetospirillum kuznetsovii]|uniref:Polymerase nucleotidyl transferase domain-containing protein n=1 Tax=Paramagnetospirillum kuznetsovii TaxID=2053833 RepID=A0A364P0S9_9PROT|nr:nucleotidyltransferase family protein [Paramagnetospirillum kuznetsovii]RAU22860.1 hypothetical protein CU669_05610 [Paramagnetospirillum kuznetsovii]
MGALASLHRHREEILRLAETFKARDVRVFGSASRGEEREDSDVDFLVAWEEQASLTDWAGFQQELERLLGRKVDVVSEASLHWYIRDKVLSEACPLP